MWDLRNRVLLRITARISLRWTRLGTRASAMPRETLDLLDGLASAISRLNVQGNAVFLSPTHHPFLVVLTSVLWSFSSLLERGVYHTIGSPVVGRYD